MAYDIYIIGSNTVGSIVEATLVGGGSINNISYQWCRSSVYNGVYEDISGSTSETYKIVPGDHYIKCRIIANYSDSTYVYEQTSASSRWVINHNRNEYSSVTIVDSSNTVVRGEVTYQDSNTIIVEFSSPFIGKAYLNGSSSGGDPIIKYSNVLVVAQINPEEYSGSKNKSELSIIGSGLSYAEPISKVSGSSNIVYDLARINQSIKLILSTAPGEVPMIPTLGCRIHEMLFEGATQSLLDQIRLEVEKSLGEQEPRIRITKVDTTYDDNHTISVAIGYVVKNTNVQSKYIHNVVLNEGGT